MPERPGTEGFSEHPGENASSQTDHQALTRQFSADALRDGRTLDQVDRDSQAYFHKMEEITQDHIKRAQDTIGELRNQLKLETDKDAATHLVQRGARQVEELGEVIESGRKGMAVFVLRHRMEQSTHDNTNSPLHAEAISAMSKLQEANDAIQKVQQEGREQVASMVASATLRFGEWILP